MRPSSIPPTFITTTIKSPKNKVLKCIWLMRDVDICLLRPATLPQVIAEVTDIGLLRPATISLVILEYIIVVMLSDMDLCHNIPATFSIKIREQ